MKHKATIAIKSRAALLLAAVVLSVGAGALAQQRPKSLTAEQRQKLDQYILDYIKVLRASETQPQPAME